MSVPPYNSNPSSYPSAPQPAWPPQPGGGGMYGGEPANDSGQKGGVPPQIAAFKWHWGAFGVNWIWALNHGLVALGIGMLLLGWIPFVGLIFAIYFGVSGHKLAWQNRRYEGGFAQYMQVENIWSTWGIVLVVLSLLAIPIDAAILFPVFAKAREKARYESMHQGAMLIAPNPSGLHTPLIGPDRARTIELGGAANVMIRVSKEWGNRVTV